jgi:roadblock/LC7 domain-containing protein
MGGNDGDSAQPTSKAGSKQLQTKGLNSHKKAGKAVAFSPNGLVLASTSYTTVRLWNTATGKEVQELKGHRGAVNAIAFSPDGKTVASASDDSTVRFWHVATGLETQELEGHGGAVNAIAFSPDGEIVASASEDSTVRLWHVATGLEIHQLEGHNNAVRAIAFSPDGKVVASTSDDSTVRLWDAAAGKQLQKHENPHYDLPTISSINLKTNPFNEPDGSDPTLKLNKAIRRRDTNSVITLIASGVDVNRPFNVNRSPNGSKREWFGTPRLPEGYPIYHAAEVGEEITQLLIDAGARVNTSFRALGTALQNAAARGTYETMELLIAAGADVNASPGARGTPLIAAITDARYGFRKVRLLLRHGAEVCTPPSAGICTPIEEAMMEGHTELVPLLVAHGVSIADAVEAWKKNSDRQFPELWLQLSRKRPYNSVSQVMIDIEDASAVKTIRSIKLDWKSPDLLGSENKSDPVSMHEEHPLVDSYMEQFVLVDECPEGSDVDTVLGATCLDCVHDHWGQDAVAFLRCLLSNVLSQRQGNSERTYQT